MSTAANKKTGNTLFQQANEAYFDDEFEQAESLYTQAIAADSTVGDYYLKRAQVRGKLGKTETAAKDALQASVLAADKSDQLRQYFKALYLHGKWATELKQYDAAAASLRRAALINPSHEEVKTLLDQVEPLTTPAPEPEPEVAAENEPVAPKRPNVRHEWYQTDENVILEVFIKRVQKDAATVEFEDKGVSLSIKMATGAENNYEFEPLAHDIIPGESAFEVLSTKIEIRLKKAKAGLKWDHLEATDEQASKLNQLGTSRKGVSWDAIAAAAEKETKLSASDQSVNELFQSIYKDADADTQRAMMKSYIESNGTSLSTDWKSVSKGPVETLPPTDTYAKSYSR
ncbi:Cochaperone protein [Coemansia sp. RSA 2706]|nr:Cochaperone protein [Coemansia sp. RSA 2711]KAJ2302550.1 Cochaperone protein [Coemansia sp. RSA 2706]KAJ2313405.1 Cochaperone protein [Coemansia sp. RSA 2705]KAJ2319979.1 Cochaperone protein [Coemansia sp. RSA 2704]KAJ2325082.1 Cochaperone protein [Coemansia sp. RSA 2702]KAJ2367817.1 Cochaperone protein [Coemansia sp. RSA 2610]KAJ2390566.1 Cochaperone protein [Coemansia sp. RSA 2611]KAJ2737884.1 Cochaperone protein [Coemansia sp. Cherry 401B]